MYLCMGSGVVFVINQPLGDVQGWNIDRRSRSTVAQGHSPVHENKDRGRLQSEGLVS